jgi:hypothetical protein
VAIVEKDLRRQGNFFLLAYCAFNLCDFGINGGVNIKLLFFCFDCDFITMTTTLISH